MMDIFFMCSFRYTGKYNPLPTSRHRISLKIVANARDHISPDNRNRDLYMMKE